MRSTITTESTATRNRRTAGVMNDATMQSYFSDLDKEGLMSAEQERQLAETIVQRRADYWTRLLDYGPFLEPIVGVVKDALGNRDRMPKKMSKMIKAAEVLRGRPRQAERAKAEKVRAGFAAELAVLDPSLELADRIFADIELIDAGNAKDTSLGVRSPARTSVTFARYLHSLRSARMSLRLARQEMVRANLRLVVTMAHRYKKNGRLPLADLVQEGNLGLMTAVDRFDPSKGFRFSTYGTWWIRHAIGRALSDKGRAVRLPVHVVELQHKIAKARREFEADNHRAPDRDELSALIDVPISRLAKLEASLLHRDTSFDKPGREGAPAGIEVIADEGPGAERLLHDDRLDTALEEAFEDLRPMEVDILRHRFGLDGSQTMTLQEVGKVHGLSRERIRQLQERALEKMRVRLKDAGFEALA